MGRKKSFLTVTDQFCGAGGSSLGAAAAGAEIYLALNHWKLAIQTHNANFPNTHHDCTDISACDPRRYSATDILITSPECTNHSLAKGKKRKMEGQLRLFGKVEIDPAEERSRATMWDVPRFAEFHDYNLIIVENVVDARKWVMFDAWVHAMQCLGYDHDIVYFNSMFAHPTPQSRDRMYVVFWKRGNKRPDLEFRPLAYCGGCGRNVEAIQSWKNPTKKWGRWGRYGVQYLYRCPACTQEVTPYYYAAFNCIDWSIQAERIGDRKRSLADKTLERIRYGLAKYGREPLIITGRYTSGVECRVKQAAGEPLPTQPADASHAVLYSPPFLIETKYNHAPASRTRGMGQPLMTQTAQQSVALAIPPFLVRTNRTGSPTSSIGEPHPTQTTCQDMGLIVPAFISKQYGVEYGRPGRHAIGLEDTLGTITTQDHHALIGLPFIAELRGTSRARGVDEPLGCITAGGNNHALIAGEAAQAFLSYYYGNMQASGIEEPLRTVTGNDRAGLVTLDGGIQVEDCTFRMLQPHEIGHAMAFPADYQVFGNSREKVKQFGNAVTPPIMQMLMERCAATFQ